MALRPPTPNEVLAWVAALSNEIARAPQTLRQARRTLHELSRLPEQIDELTAALDRTTATIEHSLPELTSTVIGALHERVANLDTLVGGAMAERLEHMDQVVSELGRTLTALIGSIPGARRALRAPTTPSG